MSTQLHFSKMHGLGNDFLVTEALSQPFDLSREQIRNLADRRTGVGFDQLLLIEPPLKAYIDFNYRIFNADGNEVEQCGNGVRCLAKYVRDKKLCGKRNITVSTQNSMMQIETVSNRQFKANMGTPRFLPSDVHLAIDETADTYTLEHAKGKTELAICSMGNPHAVIKVDDVDTADVETVGPLIERHSLFTQGVNAGFLQIIDRQTIRLRVFERGVGETKACGSGACAAAAVARKLGWVDETVNVQLRGGKLTISWRGDDAPLFMSGPAVTVYDGRAKL